MSTRQNAPKTTTPGDLGTRAMLVRCRIHRWGAKVNDSDVAGEIARSKKSDPELTKFTKQLLRSDALDSYRKSARQCRRIIKFYTMPWDDGVYLLPSDLYFKLMEELGEEKREAEQYIKDFVAEYKEQWQAGLKAYRTGLGDLFNQDDYPDPNRVASKFGINIRTYPIQDPNDFRVKMSANVSAELKQQMQADFQDSFREALRNPIMRLYETVMHVKEKLDDGEAIFRDSLIGNVQKLVDILPALNVTNDKQIAALIQKTDREICGVSDMKALRTDAQYRKEVAKSADAILKQMKGYVS